MKRKISVYLILILIVSLLLSGCNKSNKKELLEAFDKSSKIVTHESITEWDFDFIPSDLEDNLAGDIFNQINMTSKMTLKAKADNKNQQSLSTLSTSIMGMTIDMDIIVDGETLAIRSPLFTGLMGLGDKYLITKLNDVLQEKESSATIDMDYLETSRELNKVLTESLKSTLKDDKITTKDKVSLESPEGKIEGKEYTIDLSNEDIKGFIKSFLINALKNKTLRKNIIGLIKDNKDLIKEGISQSDLEKNPKESIDKIFEKLNLQGNIKLSFLVDKDKYIRSRATVFSLSIENKETKKTESLSMDVKQEIWNINKPLDLKIPEFTEENSIKMDELKDNPFITNF